MQHLQQQFQLLAKLVTVGLQLILVLQLERQLLAEAARRLRVQLLRQMALRLRRDFLMRQLQQQSQVLVNLATSQARRLRLILVLRVGRRQLAGYVVSMHGGIMVVIAGQKFAMGLTLEH